MKEQTQALLQQLKPFTNFVQRYLTFIVLTLFLLIYTVLVVRIDQFSGATPSDAEVASKQQTISHPKVNQATLGKIQQLQNQNIQVQALFNQARNNPFSE